MFKKLLRNKFVRRLIVKFMVFFSALNKIVPKNEKVILFYDGASKGLRDNSEALFTYMINSEYDQNYKIYLCLPMNKEKYVRGMRNFSALGGAFMFMRAKYVFFSFGDMRIVPTSNQMVINLWHGMPLKRIGKLTKDESYLAEKLDSFSYMISTSDFFTPALVEAFGIDKNRVIINGLCRTDFFDYQTYRIPDMIPKYKEYKKFILWMPTFRNSISGRFHDSLEFKSETGLPIMNTYEKLISLNQYCEDNSIALVIKAHGEVIFNFKSLSSIYVFTNEDLEKENIFLYEFVKDFDSLITDYSSIYFDFMILDRPIAFTIDDIDSYKRGRGFIVENPLSIMPGVKIKTYDEFLNYLGQQCIGRDEYKIQRNELNKLFNENSKNACESLLKKINLYNK